MPFHDRRHAGRLLAERLKGVTLRNPIVIALPRGGVPIGHEIAQSLGAPLEVVIVRKIGAPSHPEYGIGAVTEDLYFWIDQDSAHATGSSPAEIERVLLAEQKEVERRIKTYRQGRPLPDLRGRSVIVVDDGLATGVTARVACNYLKTQGAAQVILAVPVCSPRTAELLRSELDDVICLEAPDVFFSVGQFYQDFSQTSDEEVLTLLKEEHMQKSGGIREDVRIPGAGFELFGSLAIPNDAQGIVIFAHGSGSGRLSPRNQQVAGALNEAGLGTLLFDLLTEEESEDRRNVFDIPLLASRLVLATQWFKRQKYSNRLSIGFFGASTGAGAALWAAADLRKEISAVVSRGGRPDLAIPRLPQVTAPTLLIVGENDEPVITMNQEAMKHLATSNLIIIPGATHLFEEAGTLEQVAEGAKNWFTKYLKKAARGQAA